MSNLKKIHKTDGFTLVELLLAMTVFSFVLVIATVGFIGMNRTYTRGLIRKNLSESTQRVSTGVTRSVRSSSRNQIILNCDGTTVSAGCTSGFGTVCLGETRYFWFTETSDVGGMYEDNEAANCGVEPTVSNLSAKNKVLDTRFKVRAFKVLPVSGSGMLFTTTGVFTTADNSALSGLPSGNIACRGTTEVVTVQSCAVEKFSFVVSSRGAQL